MQFRMLRTAGIDADAAAGGLTASSLLGVGGLLLLPILTLPAILGGAPVNHTLESAALIGVAGFVVYLTLAVVLLATDRPLRDVGRGGPVGVEQGASPPSASRRVGGPASGATQRDPTRSSEGIGNKSSFSS